MGIFRGIGQPQGPVAIRINQDQSRINRGSIADLQPAAVIADDRGDGRGVAGRRRLTACCAWRFIGTGNGFEGSQKNGEGSV
jgi:hypothetical protein